MNKEPETKPVVKNPITKSFDYYDKMFVGKVVICVEKVKLTQEDYIKYLLTDENKDISIIEMKEHLKKEILVTGILIKTVVNNVTDYYVKNGNKLIITTLTVKDFESKNKPFVLEDVIKDDMATIELIKQYNINELFILFNRLLANKTIDKIPHLLSRECRYNDIDEIVLNLAYQKYWLQKYKTCLRKETGIFFI